MKRVSLMFGYYTLAIMHILIFSSSSLHAKQMQTKNKQYSLDFKSFGINGDFSIDDKSNIQCPSEFKKVKSKKNMFSCEHEKYGHESTITLVFSDTGELDFVHYTTMKAKCIGDGAFEADLKMDQVKSAKGTKKGFDVKGVIGGFNARMTCDGIIGFKDLYISKNKKIFK